MGDNKHNRAAMSRPRETNTDPDIVGIVDPFDSDLPKKPNWVNLAQLDTPVDDALVNNLLYKPALRYHGLTSGLWGLGLSRTPSIVTDSKPPSYKFSDPLKSKHNTDTFSTSDQGSMYRTKNLSALSPVTLRRRNTIAVILVAIGLLAAVATITGLVLHAMQPNDLLRAHVRFTIANENYTESMLNKSSEEFAKISRTLCSEMDFYYLTSELSDFYLGCRLISLRNDTSKPGLAVHYTIDFKDNPTTNDKDRIKNVILRKSGRQASDANLYFVIRDYLVYLRSLRVELEKVPITSKTPDYNRPIIPWRDDIDFIARKSIKTYSKFRSTATLTTGAFTKTPVSDIGEASINAPVLKRILPVAKDVLLPMLNHTALYVRNNKTNTANVHVFTNFEHLATMSKGLVRRHPDDIPLAESIQTKDNILRLFPTRVRLDVTRMDTVSQKPGHKHFREMKLQNTDIIENIIDLNDMNPPLAENNLESIFALPNLPKTETNDIRVAEITENGWTFGPEPHHHHQHHLGNHKHHGLEKEINMNPVAASLQSSFSAPLKQFDQIIATTPLNADLSREEIITQSKIMTISKNVFLINGQSSKNYIDKILITPTPSIFPSHLAITSLDMNFDNVKDESKQMVFPSRDLSRRINVQSFQKEIHPLRKTENVIVQTLTSSPTTHRVTSTAFDTAFPSIDVFLNELVVPNPQRTSINPQQTDIKWMNIFNVPRRRVAIDVADAMTKLEKRIEVVPRLHRLNASEDSVSFAIRDLIPEFKHKFPQFSSNTRNIRMRRPEVQVSSLNKKVVFSNIVNNNMDTAHTHDHARENHHRHFAHQDHTLSKKENNHDNHQSKHSLKLETNFREFADLNDLKEHIFEHNTDREHNFPQLGRLEDQHPNFREHLEQEREHEDHASKIGEQEQANLFFDVSSTDEERMVDDNDAVLPESGRISGRNRQRGANIGGINVQNEVENSRLKQLNFGMHNGQSESQSRNRNPFNLPIQSFASNQMNFVANNMNPFIEGTTFTHRNTFHNRQRIRHVTQDHSHRNTGIRNPTHFSRQRLRLPVLDNDIIMQNEDQGHDELDSTPLGGFAFTDDRGGRTDWRFHIRREALSPGFDDHAFQKMQFYGIPISSDFNNIDDIKTILGDVIHSLFNMTKKIDNMQKAIDFINDQLHEERRPLFRLGDTLKNMTTSLDNLKLNLKNINTTLDGFRKYLKQFDNTIFDVHDVLKYLDDTFNNLEKTVSFVGNSLKEMGDSVDLVDDVFITGNSSLEHLNNSAYGVKETTNFANKTLDSMGRTLESLENAVSGLNVIVDDILINMDGINVSLTSINGSVQNSHKRMNGIIDKMKIMNISVNSIEKTVVRLNRTYIDINDALSQLNETFVFINGTTKDAIRQLQYTDNRLNNISQNMIRMRNGMTTMNMTLEETMDWMRNMVETLVKFNASLDRQNDSITMNLQNADVIESLSTLLGMNQTLNEFGNNVDHINQRLDDMEIKLRGLDKNLDHLQETLNNLNVTFREINASIETSNNTITLIKKSLHVMNSSFGAINETLSDLTNEFGSIEKTLDSLNSSFLLVQQNRIKVEDQAQEISSTLVKLNDKINITSTQIEIISDEFYSDITDSPLSHFEDHLHNTNVSIQKVQNQTKGLRKSHTLLEKTILGLKSTVKKLFSKVKESDESLLRVNESLINIDESIQNMEQTKSEWTELLRKLKNSSNAMQNSMKDLGFAFPNIATSLNDLDTSIAQLEDQINAQSIAIKHKQETKENNYNRFLKLKRFHDSILKALNDSMKLISSVERQSGETDLRLSDLSKKSENLGNQFENMEKNIKLFNESLSPFQERHNKIQNDINDNDFILNNLSKTFIKQKDHLRKIKDTSNEFLNLMIPFEEIQQTLSSNLLTADENLGLLKSLKENLTKTSSKIWNVNDQPLDINQPHFKVKAKFKLFNEEMNDASKSLDKTILGVKNLYTSSSDIEDKLSNLLTVMEKMKHFENISTQSKNSLFDLEYDLKQWKNDWLKTQDYIENLKANLKDLELQYGNINGTSNTTSKDYDYIEQLLFEASRGLGMSNDDLDNVRLKLESLKNRLNEKVSEYSSGAFDGSKTSQDEINLLISDVADYSDIIKNITFFSKNNSLESTNKTLITIDSMLKKLEENLKDKNDKHNLLKILRPPINGQFSTLDFNLIHVNDSIENLENRLSIVLQHADRLVNRSKGIQNMNINLEKEYLVLNRIGQKLFILRNNISSLNISTANAKNNFRSLQNSNLSFEGVKRRIKELKNEIYFLNRSANLLNKEAYEEEGNLDYVSTSLRNLETLLDKYIETSKSTDELSTDLDMVTDKFQTTGEKLKDVQMTVEEIESTFLKLQNNYTNFTDTSVNLKDRFLVDTLGDAKSKVADLLDEFMSIANTSSIMTEDFNLLRSIMNGTKFNRSNVERIIEEHVFNGLKTIRNDINKLNTSLDNVNEGIETLSNQVTDLEEILHISNNQLRIDKQKKIIAEANLPKLELKRKKIDALLMNIDSLFTNVSKNVNETTRFYDYFVSRLEDYPNLNISTDDLLRNISLFTNTIAITQPKIQTLYKESSGVDNLLMTDQGGYTVNETIDGMKTRFSNASDKMSIILENIEYVQHELIKTIQGSNLVKDEISSLNTTMNEYDKADLSWIKLNDDFQKLIERANNATLKDEIFYSKSERILRDITNLSTHFKHVNKSILNDVLEDLFAEHRKNVNDIKNITNFVIELQENINLLEEINYQEKENKSKTIFGKNGLEEFNTLKVNGFNYAISILNETNNLYDILDNKTDILEENLYELEGHISNVSEVLKRQEKKELYTRFSAENRFSNANSTLQNLMKLIYALKQNISSVNEYSSEVENNYDNVTNLNISFAQTVDVLNEANRTLNQDRISLKNKTDQLQFLKILLRTNDGKHFSDTESIFEMRDRYDQLQLGIQEILRYSDNISDRFHEILVLLPKEMQKLTHSSNVLMRYMNVTEHLNTNIDSMNILNTTFESKNNESNQRKQFFENLNEQFVMLKSEFDNFNDTDAIDLLKMVDRELRFGEDLIASLSKNLKDIQEERDRINDKVNYFSIMSNQTFSSVYDLEEFVQGYNNISEKLDKEIALVEDEFRLLTNKSVILDESLDITGSMIANLTDIIKHKKKEVLVHAMNKQIMKVIETTMPRFYDTSMVLKGITKELNGTSGKLLDLEKSMSNIITVQISLRPERDSLKFVNDSLLSSRDKLRVLQNKTENIRKKAVGMETGTFIRENSIGDIKNKLSDLLNALGNISLNISNIEDELTLTNVSNKNIKDTLSSLDDYLRFYRELTLQENEAKRLYKNATLQHIAINKYREMNKDLVIEINNTLSSINHKYSTIHDPDLWERYNGLELDFANESNMLDESGSREDNINKTLLKNDIIIDKISSYINQPIGDIDSLEKRNTVLRSLFKEMNLIEANMSADLIRENVLQADLNKMLNYLKENLKDTEKEFKKRKISNYMKTQFPRVIDRFDFVNATFREVEKKLTSVQELVYSLKQKINNTDSLLESIPSINISLSIQQNASRAASSALREAFIKGDTLESTLKNISDIISNRIDKNDTINLIEERLDDYIENLDTILIDVDRLNTSIERISFQSSESLSSLLEMDRDIRNLKELENKRNSTKYDLLKIKTIFSEEKIKHASNENMFDKIQKLSFELDDNITISNSTELQSQLNALVEDVSKLDSIMNETTQKILDIESSLMDNFKKINDTHKFTNQFITDINTLPVISEKINKTLFDTEQKIRNKLESSLTLLKQAISNESKLLDKTNSKMNSLRTQFLLEEKENYLNNILPKILKSHKQLHESISVLSENLHQTDRRMDILNNSLNKLANDIQKMENIEFNVTSLSDDIEGIAYDIKEYFPSLDEQKHIFYRIDGRVLRKQFWKNNSLEEIKRVIENVASKIDNIDTYMTEINRTNVDIIGDLLKIEGNMTMISDLLDKLKNANKTNENQRNLLGVSVEILNKTRHRVNKLASSFSEQKDILSKLNDTIGYTKNDKITQLITEIEKVLIDKVGLRLPLLGNIFQKRILEKLKKARNLHNYNTKVLNKHHTDPNALEKSIQNVERNIEIVANKMKSMNASNNSFNQEINKLEDNLNETISLLESLENNIKIELKRRYIKSVAPEISETHDKLKKVIENVKQIVPELESASNETEKELRLAVQVAEKFDNINISFISIISQINESVSTLHYIKDNVPTMFDTLRSLSLKQLNSSDWIYNNSISLSNLQKYVEVMKDDIYEFENATLTTLDDLIQINKSTTDFSDDIEFFLDNISKYGRLRETYFNMSRDMENVDSYTTNISKELKSAKLELSILNETIQSLYETYNITHALNEKLPKIMLKAARAIRDIELNFSEALVSKSDTDISLGAVNSILDKQINSASLLNTTVFAGEKMIPDTERKISQLVEFMKRTYANIPKITETFEELKEESRTLNVTLHSEDAKRKYVKKVRPKLQARYKDINATFDMTNRSLQIIQDNIRLLEENIQRIKKTMENHQTIDINISAIETNVSNMENRLAIMKGHYNNVEEVVQMLKNDLQNYSHQVGNLTLNETVLIYKDFNNSLDDVEKVLRKIDTEIADMDDHFMSINDTVFTIDDAIKSFETELGKNEKRHKELETIKISLNATKNDLNDISSTYTYLNNSFIVMQSIYKDVLNSTAENNTKFLQDIEHVQEQIVLLKETADKLFVDMTNAGEIYENMNRTIFKPVNTYIGLNDTLNDFGVHFDNLTTVVYNLAENIRKTRSKSATINMSLADLGDLLENINKTLDEEQTKYNFLNSNFGGLHSKTNQVASKLNGTNSSINLAKRLIKDANKTLEILNMHLNDNANLKISLENEVDIVNNSTENIKDTKTNLKIAKDDFEELINNLTLAKDRTGKISDIKQRYRNFNSSLDSFMIIIDTMDSRVRNATKSTKSALDKLSDIYKSVQKYEEIDSKVSKSLPTMTLVKENLTKRINTIVENEKSVLQLGKQAQDMSAYYLDVKDQDLKNNLTNLILELSNERRRLLELKSRHSEIYDRHDNATKSIMAIKSLLNSTFNSKDQLDKATNYSVERLTHFKQVPSEISLENNALEEELNSVQVRIAYMESQLYDLNDTLFEEKMKMEFVKNNFPNAEARYKMLEGNLIESGADIANKSNNVYNIKNKLNELKTRFKSMPSLDFVLKAENTKSEEIENDVLELKQFLQNITEHFDTFNISKLTDKTKSFNILKGNYDIYNTESQRLENDIGSLRGKLKILNDKLKTLNLTTSDISVILDEFEDVNRNTSSIFNDFLRFNGSFDKMINSIVGMENKLAKLNETLMNIITNFTEVKSPSLLKAKEYLEVMVAKAYEDLSKLRNSTDYISSLNAETNDKGTTLNLTLSKKKSSLNELKTDIANANALFNNISSLLDILNMSQSAANGSIGSFKPDIKSITDGISKLYTAFESEQRKLDYIKNEVPILETSFKNLKGPFENINKKLANTEMNLTDLKLKIDSVGSRLNRFKPIHITTDLEDNSWQKLSKITKEKSNEFIKLSRIYNNLTSEILKVGNKNESIDSLKIKYKTINETIDRITQGLTSIQNNLTEISNTSSSIDDKLGSFEKIMDDFKSVQVKTRTLKKKIETNANDVAAVHRETNTVKKNISLIKELLRDMEQMFKQLSNEKWERKIPEIRNNISRFDSGTTMLDTKVKSISTSTNDSRNLVDDALKRLQTSGLKRNNATIVIESVNQTGVTTSEKLDNVTKETSTANRRLTVLTKEVILTKQELENLNNSLSNELRKARFLNETLPDLRSKHSRVNSSFSATAPDIQILQNQIEDVVSVISKIKDKMQIFGLQDTDKTIFNWDQSIDKLNKTIVDIIKKNRQTSQRLKELKQKLWKDGAMYTDAESFKAVKERFIGYNNSLNEIMAAVHKIEVKLVDLDKTSQDLTATLVDHEEMLTTTPEPMGPPIWLQFTSTTVGTIGKDQGVAECSVGDLTDWEIMKITRKRKGRKEETVAAWKLGVGARKTIRERRMSVKKSENATGGNLQINIRSLQCEDEAAYYCSIDSYRKYPLRTDIAVITPPEDSLDPEFPTEVFEDKIANFSCTGHPGYPSGRLIWKIKHQNEKDFKDYNFYSAKTQVSDTDCIRTEINRVEHQFDMSWNNTKIRCYIENTQYYGEGIIRLLPYDICNKVRFLGTISHPYTPHKYIVCGKELNIMQCPGNTCYDKREENCVQCAASQQSADPCHGKPLYSYVAHERDCKKYYICMGPTKTVKKCTKGYFNPNRPGNCVMSYPESYCAQRSG